MTEDTLLPFDLPAVRRKKVTADFDGGLISSDGGLVLLRGAERRLGLAETLAGCIREWRDPALVVHTLPAMLRVWTPRLTQAFFRSAGCMRSPSTSTTPATRCTAASSSRCSTPTTTLAVSCPSTSIMSRAASRWRFSCARERRRRASRSAPSSSTWCAASAGTGRAPGSPSGERQPLGEHTAGRSRADNDIVEAVAAFGHPLPAVPLSANITETPATFGISVGRWR